MHTKKQLVIRINRSMIWKRLFALFKNNYNFTSSEMTLCMIYTAKHFQNQFAPNKNSNNEWSANVFLFYFVKILRY